MRPQVAVDRITTDAINAVNGANLRNVVRWATPVTIVQTSVGGALTISHDLRVTPNVLYVEPYIDARWWADQDDRRVWSSSQATFHASHLGSYVVHVGVQ